MPKKRGSESFTIKFECNFPLSPRHSVHTLLYVIFVVIKGLLFYVTSFS